MAKGGRAKGGKVRDGQARDGQARDGRARDGRARDGRQVIWFEELKRADVALVGGKNSSLGEMVGKLSKAGIRVTSANSTDT